MKGKKIKSYNKSYSLLVTHQSAKINQQGLKQNIRYDYLSCGYHLCVDKALQTTAKSLLRVGEGTLTYS